MNALLADLHSSGFLKDVNALLADLHSSGFLKDVKLYLLIFIHLVS